MLLLTYVAEKEILGKRQIEKNLVKNKRKIEANEESIYSLIVKQSHTHQSLAGHEVAGDFQAIGS